MREIINATEAAKVIGCKSQKVRVRMQMGLWPIGKVISKKEKRTVQNTYEVHVRKLSNYFGISLEEIEKRLNEK